MSDDDLRKLYEKVVGRHLPLKDPLIEKLVKALPAEHVKKYQKAMAHLSLTGACPTAEEREETMPEWQLIAEDHWIFGEKARGLVRVRLAEVYYDPDCYSRHGGWTWFVTGGKRGHTLTLTEAVAAAEKALEL